VEDGANAYVHPNHSGDVTSAADGATAIGSGVIVNDDVNALAAIAYSKLAILADANIVVGNAGVASSVAMTGDVSIDNAGATTIGNTAVTSGKMTAGAKTHSIIIPVPDPGTADADITAGYVLWSPSVAVTITKVYLVPETAYVAAANPNDIVVTVTNASVGTVATLTSVTTRVAGSINDMGTITFPSVVADTNVTIEVLVNGTGDAPRQNIQIEYTTVN
jgi:hypothetical protein